MLYADRKQGLRSAPRSPGGDRWLSAVQSRLGRCPWLALGRVRRLSTRLCAPLLGRFCCRFSRLPFEALRSQLGGLQVAVTNALVDNLISGCRRGVQLCGSRQGSDFCNLLFHIAEIGRGRRLAMGNAQLDCRHDELEAGFRTVIQSQKSLPHLCDRLQNAPGNGQALSTTFLTASLASPFACWASPLAS